MAGCYKSCFSGQQGQSTDGKTLVSQNQNGFMFVYGFVFVTQKKFQKTIILLRINACL